MKTEAKRNITGLILCALIFIIALMVEKCYTDYEQRNEQKHFERFEKVMTENNYPYSDAYCNYVWELTK